MTVFSSLVKKRSILQSTNQSINSTTTSNTSSSKPQVGKLQKPLPINHSTHSINSTPFNELLPQRSHPTSINNHRTSSTINRNNSINRTSTSINRTSTSINRTSLFLDSQHLSSHPPRSSSIHRKHSNPPPPLPPMPNNIHQSIHHQSTLKSPNRLIPRKSRQIPTLNLILAGSIETGKTSFLKTILGTFGISLDTITTSNRTGGIQHHSIGTVPGLNADKISLTIIDTPSLDILSNDELKVEHQVNDILRCIESKFEDTLNHEQQVKREPIRSSDTHVHCCLYFLNPNIIEPAQRLSNSEDHTPSQNELSRISMSKMDLRAMKRIGKRSNVLPVIGRSDELTIQQLNNIRTWLRTEMKQSGIDLSLFTGGNEETDSEVSDEPEAITTSSSISSSSNLSHHTESNTFTSLKTRRKSVTLSTHSHSKRIQCTLTLPRAEEALNNLIPLSLINPENLNPLTNEEMMTLNKLNPINNSIDQKELLTSFIRKFRFGIVNVLNPSHCEVLLIRSILFGTHLSKLKESTRLEKYESFRTERLIRRERFTKLITNDQQVELIKEMENILLPSSIPTNHLIIDHQNFDQNHQNHLDFNHSQYEPIVL